jgi:hypothetical protein
MRFLPACLCFLLTGCFTASLIPNNSSGVDYPSPWAENCSSVDFINEAKNEINSIKISEKSLIAINKWLDQNKSILETESLKTLSPDTKELLLPLWESYLDHFYRLEGLRIKHSSYWKINALKHPLLHALSFSIFNTAFLVQNNQGSRFINILNNHERTCEWLEEPNAQFPQYAYSRIKYRVLNFLTFDEISSQSSYFREKILPVLDTVSDTTIYWAERRQVSLPDTLLRMAADKNVRKTAGNGVDILRKQLFSFFFPLQKGLADFLGRTYYNPMKSGKYISSLQADSLEKLLVPGDLILTRSNYVASNIGLPGFWPHVALYAGKGVGKDSSNSVIEALSEGTVYRPLTETAKADYMAVLRPKLPAEDKNTALQKAFSYIGIPYDFDFDFDTDATLVCSEVVYKSFQKREGMQKGLSIPLVSIAGRWTLPPNDIAKIYAQNPDSGDFDFVAFIDHAPETDSAFFNSDSAFRTTYSRVKWDFLLE